MHPNTQTLGGATSVGGLGMLAGQLAHPLVPHVSGGVLLGVLCSLALDEWLAQRQDTTPP